MLVGWTNCGIMCANRALHTYFPGHVVCLTNVAMSPTEICQASVQLPEHVSDPLRGLWRLRPAKDRRFLASTGIAENENTMALHSCMPCPQVSGPKRRVIKLAYF